MGSCGLKVEGFSGFRFRAAAFVAKSVEFKVFVF